jgi:hypothetical protein
MNLTNFLTSLENEGRVTYSLSQGGMGNQRAFKQGWIQSYSVLPTDDELRSYIIANIAPLMAHNGVLIGVTIQYGDSKHYQLRVGTVEVHAHLETPTNKHEL